MYSILFLHFEKCNNGSHYLVLKIAKRLPSESLKTMHKKVKKYLKSKVGYINFTQK